MDISVWWSDAPRLQAIRSLHALPPFMHSTSFASPFCTLASTDSLASSNSISSNALSFRSRLSRTARHLSLARLKRHLSRRLSAWNVDASCTTECNEFSFVG